MLRLQWGMREHDDEGIRLDGKRHYVLWFSDEVGGVVTVDGGVLAFESRGAARSFARHRGWTLPAPEPRRERPLLRLDRVAFWSERPRKTIDVRLFLNSWNFLLDVANSVGAGENLVVVRYRQAAESDMYDKPFYGNNLPSITPEGRRYQPLWSGSEIQELHDLLRGGLTLLRRILRPVTP